MQIILRGLLLLLAVLNLVLGTGFLVNPENAGSDFGLAVATLHGTSTLRGDMTAFFYVTALFIALGAWRRSGETLLPALALYGIAFSGRTINLVLRGTYDGWATPMMIEGLTVVFLLFAIRAWGLARAAS